MTTDTAPSPAELFPRIVARAIDFAVLFALNVGAGQVTGFGFDWLIGASLFNLAYFVVLDVVAGATVGKLAFGLRVLGPSGGRPSPKQALLREAFTLIGSIPLVGPFLALATWIWFGKTINRSPTRQGKHDVLAGGTRVVRVGS